MPPKFVVVREQDETVYYIDVDASHLAIFMIREIVIL